MDSLDLVEGAEEPHGTTYHELDRCHRICLGSRLLLQHILLPELQHPQFLAGEEPSGGRLSGGQQDGLRPARATDTASLAPGTAHLAQILRAGRLQELHRVAPVEVQACEPEARWTERHSGVQLPRRRYHRDRDALSDRVLFALLRHRHPDMGAGSRHSASGGIALAHAAEEVLRQDIQPWQAVRSHGPARFRTHRHAPG